MAEDDRIDRAMALVREALEILDDLAETKRKPKKARRRDDVAALEAARIVKEGLKRNGFKDGKQAS